MISLVNGAGGGGGGGSNDDVPSGFTDDPDEFNSRSAKEADKETCENFNIRLERVKCRLEKKGLDTSSVEESCRVLPNPSNCQALYNKVNSCYDLNGVQKDQCFKRIAGFIGKGNLENEAKANNKGALRNYVVFLLYDLQERVEEANEQGKLDTQKSAQIIDIIIQIKEKLFLDKSKNEIKPLLEQLKNIWKDAGLK